MFRAVVFDLWMTLVTPPEEAFGEFRRGWSERLDVSLEQLDELWFGVDASRRRETGPIRSAVAELYRALDADGDLDEVIRWRLDLMRHVLVPDTGVVATLSELRRRRISTALISNCTEDVALVWEESPFVGLFDVAIFSATAGCAKPDRRIYELALSELGLDGSDCLYVGDGASDELLGAERLGMTPVLVHPAGREPVWDGLRDWAGLRISSIPEILDVA